MNPPTLRVDHMERNQIVSKLLNEKQYGNVIAGGRCPTEQRCNRGEGRYQLAVREQPGYPGCLARMCEDQKEPDRVLPSKTDWFTR